MPEHERQHYVPQFYLKNFCDVNNNRKIYCYDKVTDKSFVTTVENVAVGKLFYTASKKLKIGREEGLTKVEQEYFVKPYYKLLEIKNFKKLSHDMKKDFFIFLSVQLVRTEEFRLQIKDLHELVLFKLAKETYDKPIPEGIKIKISDIYSKLEHLLFMDIDTIVDFATYLYNKLWIVTLNKTGSKLWTSDNPISFYNSFGRTGHNLGLFSQGIEVRFALSKDLLLFSYDPKTHPLTVNRSRMSHNDVLFANQLQLVSSTRFIYSPTNDFGSATEFLQRYPKYKDPDRSRWDMTSDHDRIDFGRI